MNVKKTVACKVRMVKLCKKHNLNIPESYGTRDHLVELFLTEQLPIHVKLEGLTIYEQYIIAAHEN